MPFATETLRMGGEVRAEKRRGYLKWMFVAGGMRDGVGGDAALFELFAGTGGVQ